jgi:NAD(P)-dependent dehydrogenase (short-subunit alcohol dehydrogenase family)
MENERQMSEPGKPLPLFAPGLLAGRTALVTGASSGLGHHFAKTLGAAGAFVVLAARRIDKLDALAKELGADGVRCVAIPMDVRDTTSVRDAVARAASEAGAIDILVNNSGVALTKPLLEHTDEDWESIVDTNLSGAFRVAREMARALVDAERPGVIVNIASILGLRVARQVAAYIASKAALLKVTEAMALELAPHGIRVNAIAPGYIVTELNRAFLNSPAGESLKKRVPLGRFGTPTDLDAALLLLASDASSFMTGSVVTVDGGHHVNSL